MPMSHRSYRELTGGPFSNGTYFDDDDCLTFLNGLPWRGLRGCSMSGHAEPRPFDMHDFYGDPNRYLLRAPADRPRQTEYDYSFYVAKYVEPQLDRSRATWFSYLALGEGRRIKLITFDSVSLEWHIDGHMMEETTVEARVSECYSHLMHNLVITPSMPLERVTNHLYFLFLAGELRDYFRDHLVPEAFTLGKTPHQRPLRRALTRRLPEPAHRTYLPA